jgi:hypothetical protein
MNQILPRGDSGASRPPSMTFMAGPQRPPDWRETLPPRLYLALPWGDFFRPGRFPVFATRCTIDEVNPRRTFAQARKAFVVVTPMTATPSIAVTSLNAPATHASLANEMTARTVQPTTKTPQHPRLTTCRRLNTARA